MEAEREYLAALAREAGRGDEDAFSDLFQATHQRVYYLARQLLGDDGEAMDVTQEVFLKAWKALPELEHPEAVVTWLFRITDNLCKDRLRRHTEVLLEEVGGGLPEEEETDELLLPQELMDRAETRRLVREMIEALPGPQKEAVLLYYFAGLSVAEIAAQQECSEGTVKSRLNYGRQQIKAAVLTLEKEEGTKLYTLAPLPLLLGFLREVPAGALPGEAAFQAVWTTLAQGTGLAAGSGATAGTATAAAGGTTSTAGGAARIVGKVAGASLKTKIAAGVLAVAVVGGGAAGITALTQKDAPPPLELAVRPVPGAMIAGVDFNDYHYHDGIDLAAEVGAPVVAAQSGRVVSVTHDLWFGNMVEIDHGNGMETRYTSLSSTVETSEGAYVQAGDIIGTVGAGDPYNSVETYRIGPHLHFVLWINDVKLDPADYLPD